MPKFMLEYRVICKEVWEVEAEDEYEAREIVFAKGDIFDREDVESSLVGVTEAEPRYRPEPRAS